MAVKQILGKVTVTPKGEYSSGETYKRLDIVTSNGQSYIAKVDNTGVSVTDTNTWLQLVEKPEKGIDYFTEEDIAQLVSMVTDDSESEFNEYYNGKVSDFNSNASSKTSEFNSNYDEKVESFNTIFDTSTDNFDGNYETKLSAFNENASTQTSTFNSVVEQATSDFNSNASTLTETFNTNASDKTSAFNINASEKTQEFNDNVDEKTEQITSQLDNYVQFDNYPSNEKAGVVKSHINGFQVNENGNPNAAILSKEQYDTIENQYFISKGTLENIKDDYVGSSTPVQDLTSTVTNIQEEQDENIPKQDAEGTDNVFDDGLKSPLYDLGGDGKSEQVTTTGKNLLPNNITSQIINGVTVTKNDDGSITLNGTATSYFTLKFTDDPIILQPGTYMQSFHPSGSATPTGGIFIRYKDSDDNQIFEYSIVSTISKTLDVETTIVDYSVAVNVGTVIKNITLYPMLELGSTATSYEPYTGGQPSPSPDYPQEINSIEGSVEFACRGENLLNNILTSGTMNGITYTVNKDKSIILNGTATTITWLILNNSITFSAGTYTMSQGNDNNNVRMFCNALNGYTQNGVRTATLTEEKTSDVSVNIPEGTTVSNLTIYPMIKESTTLTEYEPYKSNQVTFNLNDEKLRSVGDVKDELVVDLSTGDYYKVENVGEVVFDGSDDENFRLYSTENTIMGFTIPLFTSNPIKQYLQSNYFRCKNTYYTWQGYGYFGVNNTGTIWFQTDNDFSSVEEFKQWLSENNVYVDYQLTTPTTKKLGTLSSEDLAKLKTFKGYNNVTVNTNLGLMNIRFTYGLDIKKYVDNKIAQLSEQLIKGE